MSTIDKILGYLERAGIQATHQTELASVLVATLDGFGYPVCGPREIISFVRWIEATFGFDVDPDDLDDANFSTPATVAVYVDRIRQTPKD